MALRPSRTWAGYWQRRLSGLDHVLPKDFDKLRFDFPVFAASDDLVSYLSPIADVQDPAICIEKNFRSSKAGALVSLFERMRPSDSHHQPHGEDGQIVLLLVVPKLDWARGGAGKLVRLENAKWLRRLSAGYNVEI